ncbi:sensor histidine kinase [Phaeovulum sp.]|uniref:sensor histidine kinase n=1 Tax=Phaeovulum sp. TaxID=2934796 RepID=UPI0039E268F2
MTPPRKSWSLRGRLTRRVLGLVIGGWLVTIGLSAYVMTVELNEMFDEELQVLVETAVLFLDTAQDAGVTRSLGVETNDSERILRLLPKDGPEPPAPWPALTTDGFHDVPGWRVLRHSAEGMVIEAVQSTDWRREEIAETASIFLVLVFPLVVLLVWGLRRLAADTVVPIHTLAAEVALRKPDNLSPVDGQNLPQELQPLASAFDSYLGRIDRLRKAERDFIANAAHELRTPLATIRARLELSADPDATAAVPTIDALTRRVERLLQLARSEAGVGIGQGPADMLRILGLLLRDIRPRSRHAIQFDDGDLNRLMVAADPDALAILLRNVLENAVDHGIGTIKVRLMGNGTLTIENPTASPTFAASRFEPGEGSDGSGLGLSIITALAKAMGVTLTRRAEENTIAFSLDVPLSTVSET